MCMPNGVFCTVDSGANVEHVWASELLDVFGEYIYLDSCGVLSLLLNCLLWHYGGLWGYSQFIRALPLLWGE